MKNSSTKNLTRVKVLEDKQGRDQEIPGFSYT